LLSTTKSRAVELIETLQSLPQNNSRRQRFLDGHVFDENQHSSRLKAWFFGKNRLFFA
jgi:hypothetical protein